MKKVITKTSQLFALVFLFFQTSSLYAQNWDELHGFSNCDTTKQVASNRLNYFCSVGYDLDICLLDGYTATNEGACNFQGDCNVFPYLNNFCTFTNNTNLIHTSFMGFRTGDNVDFVQYEIQTTTCSGFGVGFALAEITNINCEEGWIIHCTPEALQSSSSTIISAPVQPNTLYLILAFGVDSLDDYCGFSINVLSGASENNGFTDITLTTDGICGNNPLISSDDGLIVAQVNPSNADYVYEWYDVNGALIPNPNNLRFLTAVQIAGTYQLKVYETSGCCLIGTQEIDVDFIEASTLPSIQFNMPDNPVIEESFLLDATPIFPSNINSEDYTWAWFDANEMPIGPSPIFSNNRDTTTIYEPGIYYFMIAHKNFMPPCRIVKAIIVTDSLTTYDLTINVSLDTLTCNDAMSVLTVNTDIPNATVEWYSPLGVYLGESTQLEIFQPGTYKVFITNPATGYSIEKTITIYGEITIFPTISGDSLICNGSFTELSLSESYEFYSWSTGEITPSITVDFSGIYYVTVSNQNCIGYDSFDVEVIDEVHISGSPGLCPGSSAILDAGSDFDTYLWNTGEMTQSIQINEAGTYSVAVTLANGCMLDDTIVVEEDSTVPEIDVSDETILFCADSGAFIPSSNVIQVGTNYIYKWTNPDGICMGDTFLITTGGVYTLLVTNTDNGCTISDTVTVSEVQPPNITLEASSDEINCTHASITISASSDNPDVSYIWTDVQNNLIGNGLDIEVFQPGIYTVVATSNSDGCTTQSSITISQGDTFIKPSILGTPNICAGEATTLSLNEIYDSYLWSTGETTATIVVSTAGSYAVTVTDANCIDFSSFELYELEVSTDFIAGSSTFCSGSFTVLDAGSNFDTYLWSTGETSQSIQINAAGTYSITVTNANTCTSTDEVTVTESSQLEPIIAQQSLCNDIILLSVGSGFDTYEWSTGETTSSIIIDALDTYCVTVAEASNCIGETCIDIVTMPPPVLNLTTATESSCGCKVLATNIDLNNSNYSFDWSNTSLVQINNQLLACQNGIYELNATNLSNGCVSTASIEVILDDDSEDEGCVWPGDTNIDGIVNAKDCLNIGIAKGTAGPSRPGGDDIWRAQYPLEWNESTPTTFVNFMHVDASGQGVIGQEDFKVVKANWGLTHNFTDDNELEKNDLPIDPRNLVDIPFYVQVDTLIANEITSIPIILGEEDIAVEGFYGMVFSIYYDAEMLNIMPDALSFEDSWLGTFEDDMYALYKDFPNEGRIEIGITRYDGEEIDGHGIIAHLNINTQNINQDFSTTFYIGEVLVIASSELEITTAPKETTTVVNAIITATTDLNIAPAFDLYPNPAQHELTIESKNTVIENIKIYTITGQEMQVLMTKQQSYILDVSNYDSGLYFIKIKTKQGEFIKKVAIH